MDTKEDPQPTSPSRQTSTPSSSSSSSPSSSSSKTTADSPQTPHTCPEDDDRMSGVIPSNGGLVSSRCPAADHTTHKPDNNNNSSKPVLLSPTSPFQSSGSEHWGFTVYYGKHWTRMRKRPRQVTHLRTFVRLTIMCVRLCQQSLDNLAKRKGEYESVMQVLDEVGAQLTWGGGLTFSPRDFRANKSQGLHRGTRRLLQQDPSTRSVADNNTLLVALKNIPAFAEYPKKMQRKLCQVGRFEAYEPRRVILREGDPPTSFYFILSGAVLVTTFDVSTGTSRTLVSLTKGMSFGELAVISNTKRQATVCSKTEVELLSISGKEFEEIFMAGGRNIMGSEKQSDFMKSVRFLHHWPIHELKGNSRTCSVYYFDRNQVLVRDSNNSDWIYIVLKGSLSVIKKLKRVEAQNDDAILAKRRKVSVRDSKSKKRPLHLRHSFNEGSNPKHHSTHKRLTDWTSHKMGSLDSILTNGHSDSHVSRESSIYPRISDTPNVYFKNPMELEHRLEQTLPGYHNSVDRLGSLDYDRIIQEHKTRLVQKSPVLTIKGNTGLSRNGHAGNLHDGSSHHSQNGIPRSFKPHHNHQHDMSLSGRGQQQNGSSTSSDNPHRSSFLPSISDNNRVVQTNHRSNNNNNNNNNNDNDNNNTTIVKNGKRGEFEHDDNVDEDDVSRSDGINDEDDDNDADDEDRLSPPFTGIDRKRHLHRKRKTISKTSKGVYLAPSHDGKHKRSSKTVPDNDNGDMSKAGDEDDYDLDLSTQDTNSREGQEESISEKLAKLQIQYQRRVTEGEGRKTIAEELDYKARREYKFTEADLDPTIIELQVLERGQYFGLSNVLFPDQPSLSVISNGAECVVISKKFFLRLASEKCLRHLRQTESPYPSDEQLRQKLQEVVNWQSKRSSMYRSLESNILEKQAKRKQCLAYYQGQYCFRTGPI